MEDLVKYPRKTFYLTQFKLWAKFPAPIQTSTEWIFQTKIKWLFLPESVRDLSRAAEPEPEPGAQEPAICGGAGAAFKI